MLFTVFGITAWQDVRGMWVLWCAGLFTVLTGVATAVWWTRSMSTARPAMRFQFASAFATCISVTVTGMLVLVVPQWYWDGYLDLFVACYVWNALLAALLVWWSLRRRSDGRGRDLTAPRARLKPTQIRLVEVENVILANDPLYENDVQVLRDTDCGFLVGNFKELIGAKFGKERSDMIGIKRTFFDLIDIAWKYEKTHEGPKLDLCNSYHDWSWGEIVDRVNAAAA